MLLVLVIIGTILLGESNAFGLSALLMAAVMTLPLLFPSGNLASTHSILNSPLQTTFLLRLLPSNVLVHSLRILLVVVPYTRAETIEIDEEAVLN